MSRIRRKASLAVRPVVNSRRVTAAQASRLKAADQAERAGEAARARRLRLSVEQELAAATEADWRSRSLRESAELEAGRGGVVDIRPGRVRVGGRDGLEALRVAGGLSATQAGAGLRYRDRFEAAQARFGSALNLRPGGGRGRPGVPEGVALRITQANRDLERMEQAVRAHYAGEGRPALAADALAVMRTVAGLGGSIRDLASSGARRAALKDRLIEALDAVAGARA